MAGSVRCLMKLNLGLLSKNVTRQIVFNQRRTLFDQESLGMVAFNGLRNTYKSQLIDLEDSFRTRMKSYVDNEATGMIFTEDLKVMLHLVENTPEDKELMLKMLKKFYSQSDDLRFSNFVFGPIVMRAMHRLDDSDLALELFNDPTFATFFNQLSSYQILMDLLLRHKRYNDMIEVYNTIKGRLTDGKVHPRNALILVTAACYKENTPESWKYALDLWRDLEKRGYPIIRRVLMHLAALAINQNQPLMALEMLILEKNPRYIAIRSLRVMAYADLDRLDDVIKFFRASLERDDPMRKKEMYLKDAIEKVEAAIERANVSEDAEIRKLLKLIKTGDHAQETTFDDLISEEMKVVQRKYTITGGDQPVYSKKRFSSGSPPQVIRRPGLRDI